MNRQKNDVEDRYPADTELKFFGSITASVTHELNNVISIINQTGGLLEDLLAGTPQNQSIAPDRLHKIAEKIIFQTERGVNIIRRLNSFAHSTDQTVSAIDLGEILENLGALMERFALLKGVSLTTESSGGSFELITNPFKIQQVTFLAFKEILSAAQKGDSVALALEEAESKVRIGIRLRAKEDRRLSQLTDLKAHAEQLGANIDSGVSSDGIFIEIIIGR